MRSGCDSSWPSYASLVRSVQRAGGRHLVQHFLLLVRVLQQLLCARVLGIALRRLLSVRDVGIHLAQAVFIGAARVRGLLRKPGNKLPVVAIKLCWFCTAILRRQL